MFDKCYPVLSQTWGGLPNWDNRYIWRDDWLECHRLVDPVTPVPVRARASTFTVLRAAQKLHFSIRNIYNHLA